MAKDEETNGINIRTGGNVQGFITTGSIKIKSSTITIGDQIVQVDKEPNFDELKKLLAEITRELAEITAEKEGLAQISKSTPIHAQAAEMDIKQVVEKIEGESTIEPKEAMSLQKSVTNATNTLANILDGAKTVAKKTVEVGKAVKPIVDKLEPLVTKLGAAALWIDKLWPQA